jgi:hypothetical protein
MADGQKIPTALGEPVTQWKRGGDAEVIFGKPPVVLQTQPYGYVRLETPEQLKQWEEDLRTFYGISIDASAMGGRACETCSCCCTDDCGILETV